MKIFHDVVVIGDGPSGISTFNRLKSNGVDAAIISCSSDLEESIYSRYSIIDNASPATWKFLSSTAHKIRKTIIPNSSDNLSNFTAVEYFGVGGLSNRWGAGCSKLDNSDIRIGDDLHKKIAAYYDAAEIQVGIQYYEHDLLDDYLGIFKQSKNSLNFPSVISFNIKQTEWAAIGKTRQAFIQNETNGRKTCNNCGGCFILCQNKTIYNARFQLAPDNQKIYPSSKVIKITKNDCQGYILTIVNAEGLQFSISTKIVVLAAGTIGTAKLVSTLHKNSTFETTLHHSVLARAVYFSLRKEPKSNFPMGQYIAKVKIDANKNSYISLTHGTSIPSSDIVDLLPIKNNLAYKLVNYFKRYLVVAMVFYPSDYSSYKIKVNNDSIKIVNKNPSRDFFKSHSLVSKRLRKIMRLNRLLTLPGFNTVLQPGLDIHYGGTIPIGPNEFENCMDNCEIRGMSNIYVVDASWMPRIPEKPHTFTLIANGLRVADEISLKLKTNYN